MTPNKDSLSVGALESMERGYRSRLSVDPSDDASRLNLAWCLLMQALHADGRRAGVGEHDTPAGDIRASGESGDLQGSALALLRECLHQSQLASMLSTDVPRRAEIERLRNLIELSGGEQLVRQIENGATGLLAHLVNEVLHPESELPSDKLPPRACLLVKRSGRDRRAQPDRRIAHRPWNGPERRNGTDRRELPERRRGTPPPHPENA